MEDGDTQTAGDTSRSLHGRRLPKFRWVLLGLLGLLALLWVVPALIETISDGEGLEGFARPHLLIGLFVAFDAVIPVLPSESLLTTAATLAGQGGSNLDISFVVLAGGLGATVGDSMLYWIARTAGRGLLQRQLDRAEQSPKTQAALAVLGDTAPLLIIVGRFVPGVRFIVNATMGLGSYPYPKFLLFSAIGSFVWAGYTCVFSFVISGALDGYPVLSIATSALITTGLLALLYIPLKRRYEGKLAEEAADEATTPVD